MIWCEKEQKINHVSQDIGVGTSFRLGDFITCHLTHLLGFWCGDFSIQTSKKQYPDFLERLISLGKGVSKVKKQDLFFCFLFLFLLSLHQCDTLNCSRY